MQVEQLCGGGSSPANPRTFVQKQKTFRVLKWVLHRPASIAAAAQTPLPQQHTTSLHCSSSGAVPDVRALTFNLTSLEHFPTTILLSCLFASSDPLALSLAPPDADYKWNFQ
jgi:hypothetical protein